MDNIIVERKEPLKGSNIGVYFGTFSPFHQGHYSEMLKAMLNNDGVVLIVSGYKGDRGDAIGLPLERRFRYLREEFKDEPDVRVAMLNEDNIPRYPDGWTPWLNDLNRIVQESVADYTSDIFSKDDTVNINVYSGEEEYYDYFNKHTAWTPVLTDRSALPISGTKIRNNPYKLWDYIMPSFKRHFVKKVLVVGSASKGKTTLIRRLGKVFSAPISKEYAREYEISSNITDDELTANDYAHFIQGQYDLNSEAITEDSNKGLAIFDTDAMVTKVYSKLYLKPEEQAVLAPLFDDTIKREDIDLILFITGNSEYVDDGFRNMNWSSDQKAFDEKLREYIHDFNLDNKVVNITGDTYESRFNQSKKEIEKLINT